MDTTAVVALAVLAGAALVQGIALAVLAYALARTARRLDRRASTVMRSLAPSVDHLGRAVAELDGTTRVALREAARATAALDATRADAARATAETARTTRAVAASVWKMADITRAMEQGLEAYRQARPDGSRPWHVAIDRGLAAYRTAKLQGGGPA